MPLAARSRWRFSVDGYSLAAGTGHTVPMAKSPYFPGTMTDAIILHAHLRLPLSCPTWQEPLLQALPYAHRLELERRDPVARRASLAGLGLVLMGAYRLTQREFPPQAFTFPAAGKPRLADGPQFSISHSDSWVTCLVCADTACGIDIEDRPAAAGSATIGRLQRWTATEAALKAAGLGVRSAGEVVLGESLGHALVRNQRYVLQALDDLPGVTGHVAAGRKLVPIIESVALDDAWMSALVERSFGLAAQFEQACGQPQLPVGKCCGVHGAADLHGLAIDDCDAAEGQRQLERVPRA